MSLWRIVLWHELLSELHKCSVTEIHICGTWNNRFEVISCSPVKYRKMIESICDYAYKRQNWLISYPASSISAPPTAFGEAYITYFRSFAVAVNFVKSLTRFRSRRSPPETLSKVWRSFRKYFRPWYPAAASSFLQQSHIPWHSSLQELLRGINFVFPTHPHHSTVFCFTFE